MDIVTERQAKIMVVVVALLLLIGGASLVLYDFMYGEAVVTGAAVTDMPDDSIAPGVLPSADNITNTTNTTFKGSPSDSSDDYQSLEYYGYTAPDAETRISGGGGRGGGITGGGNAPVGAMANSLPVVSSVVLAGDTPANADDENLTVTWQVSDSDGDDVYNMTTWYVNGTGIMDLFYSFENNTADTSATTKDYSNNSYTGTVTGATWSGTAGYDGFGAYTFSGTGQYITPSTLITYEDYDNFSFSYWYKGTDASDLQYGTAIVGSTSNSMVAELGIDAGYAQYGTWNGAWSTVQSTTRIDDDEWHHVAFVHYSNSTGAIWVDGVKEDEGSTLVTNGYRFMADYVMRGYSGDTQGILDDLRIYNRPLSSGQVSALYNNRSDRLAHEETELTEGWSACIVPNDGSSDGTQACSNTIVIGTASGNSAPSVSSLSLSSTSGTNSSTDNITATWSVSDFDGDGVVNVTNWKIDGTSLTVLNMPFENNTADINATTKDYSGAGNNGTVVGSPVWNSNGGYLNSGAYVFNGAAAYVDVTSNSGLSTVDQTISVWWKAGATGNQAIISKASGSVLRGWNLFQRATGGSTAALWVDGLIAVQGSTPVNDGNWYHIAVTRDGTSSTSGTYTLYVNGVLEAGPTLISSRTYVTSDDLHIGDIRSGSGIAYSNGVIDGVTLYDRVLSSDQISELASNSNVLVIDETSAGDQVELCVTPNDGYQDGTESCSSAMTIFGDGPPVINSASVSPSSPTTADSVTVNVNVSDSNNGQTMNCSLSGDLIGSNTGSTNGGAIVVGVSVGSLSAGTYDYNVTCDDGGASDTDLNNQFSVEELSISIGNTLDDSSVYASDTVEVSGQVIWNNATPLTNQLVNLYVDEVLSSGTVAEIDLTGGSGGGVLYTAPDGTTVECESSYSGSYDIDNLIIESGFWTGAYEDPQNITINFTDIKYVDLITLNAQYNSAYTQNVRVFASTDGTTWNQVNSLSNFDSTSYPGDVNISLEVAAKHLRIELEDIDVEPGWPNLDYLKIYGYDAVVTNGTGHYSSTFTAPSSAGDYDIKVNSTSAGIAASNTTQLTVSEHTLSISETLLPSSVDVLEAYTVSGIVTLDGGPLANAAVSINQNGTTLFEKIDYSGGTGGQAGAYVYNAPGGTNLTSDRPVYNNGVYYYMDNLFDGAYADRQTDGWLTNGGAAGEVALRFDFNETKCIDYISVVPQTYSGWYLSFDLQKSDDGVSYTDISSIDGSIYAVGEFVNISIGDSVNHIRFMATGLGSWGFALGEVEIYEGACTNSTGHYSKELTGPAVNGTYNISVSITNSGVSADNAKILTVGDGFTPPTQTENYVVGLGTDLSTGYDAASIQSVSGYVWASNGNGAVRWNVDLNFSSAELGGDNDINDDVTFGSSFVSVDSSAASAFASRSANITFEGVDCNRCDAQNIVYASGSSYTTLDEIQAGGSVCALSGRCSDFSCAASACSFTVTGFTGYGFGANANITVNDSAEISGSASVGEAVTYYAYYLNSTSGSLVTGASCNVTDDDATYPMSEGGSYYSYVKGSGFGSNGTKNYQVVCNHADYSRVNASDSLEVVGSSDSVDRSSSVVPVTVTVINESRWNSSAGGNDAGKGGNVTELDLSSSASTNKWAGYYGEVSGDLRLGNTDNDIMYDFGVLNQSQVKSVFASTDQNFGFATLYAATTANVDSVYSWDTTDSDSATLTLDDDTATISTLASVPVANLSASTVYQSGAFKDVAGSPSTYSELAYGVSVIVDQTAFNGYTQVDYELIVPVNSSAGTQTYYFFMDIE